MRVPFRSACRGVAYFTALLALWLCTSMAMAGPPKNVLGSNAAGTVQVAVASNFAEPMRALSDAFTRATGHKATVVLGATGQLYAQIKNGAPHHVLLSADTATPARLIEEGLAIPMTAASYAEGRLVLWSPTPNAIDAQGQVLREGRLARLAIASPKLAPYGAAAMDVVRGLAQQGVRVPQLVEASSIAQAFQFASSGNVSAGLVARSQVQAISALGPRNGGVVLALRAGSGWLVPKSLHRPIVQDAVMLQAGKGNAAAIAFLKFLQSSEARSLILAYGYDIPTTAP